MNKALRDSWTQYAEDNGLIQEGGPVPVVTQEPQRESKYGAKRIEVDGITFDSKAESQRYFELKMRERVGEIDELELQPCFPLHVMELWRSGVEIRVTTIGIFKADFRYRVLKGPNVGEIVIEDRKSEPTKTTAYKLRKRIAEAVHGIVITEI